MKHFEIWIRVIDDVQFKQYFTEKGGVIFGIESKLKQFYTSLFSA